jgi:hypothetical protein
MAETTNRKIDTSTPKKVKVVLKTNSMIGAKRLLAGNEYEVTPVVAERLKQLGRLK